MNLFQLSLELNGYAIKQAKERLDRIQLLTNKNAEAYQDEMKWKILKHHVENNSHYRTFIGGNIPQQWNQIPILTKSSIQVSLEERLTIGYSAKNTHLHNTSGSSGTPFYFAKDKDCHALSWALIQNRFGWHGVEIGKQLQARFYGIPLSTWKYKKEKLKDYIAARVRFPVFDLSDSVLKHYVEVFKKKAFHYMNGYTSSLVLMARYCIEQQLVLKRICPTLQVCFTTSEVCDDTDKALLEKGFGIPVRNEYGAAELDLIGFENTDGKFLLTNETLLVEILTEANDEAGPGEEGRVVVTSLYNKAMPFIRYELGDRIVLKDEVVSGYKVIDRVLGRTNDIAFLPSGKRSPGLTFYYISKSLLEGGGFMKEFIIKQKSLNHFHYEYVAQREINDEEKQRIQEAMNIYLENGLNASFERLDKLERTKAGKLKHFYSEIAQTT